jgi:hypothetical protein
VTFSPDKILRGSFCVLKSWKGKVGVLQNTAVLCHKEGHKVVSQADKSSLDKIRYQDLGGKVTEQGKVIHSLARRVFGRKSGIKVQRVRGGGG